MINTYSIHTLYSEIADLDPQVEHPFNIILVKRRGTNGKYLLFKNKRWNCWLFPNYGCLDGEFIPNKEISHIEGCLIRDLNVRQMRIRYLGNEISRKYSVADKINRKYNFHFFQVDDLTIDDNGKQSFQLNGKKYCWKTLDQMYSNKGMIKKNQDVLDYVRKMCDMS